MRLRWSCEMHSAIHTMFLIRVRVRVKDRVRVRVRG